MHSPLRAEPEKSEHMSLQRGRSEDRFSSSSASIVRPIRICNLEKLLREIVRKEGMVTPIGTVDQWRPNKLHRITDSTTDISFEVPP